MTHLPPGVEIERRHLPDRRQQHLGPPDEVGEDRRNPPDRRQEDYDVLDKKLDERFGFLAERLSGFIKKATFVMAIIGLACAIALVGYGLLLKEQHHTLTLIQEQRKEFVGSQCIDQNRRNEKTREALINGAAEDIANRKTEAGRQEVARRRDVTLGLIEALAPHRNCVLLVKRATSTTEGGE